jgi:hypothetical protein
VPKTLQRSCRSFSGAAKRRAARLRHGSHERFAAGTLTACKDFDGIPVYASTMDCLESRRLLLACPRERAPGHSSHLVACAACSRLAQRLSSLERNLEEAALVSVPDALSARVLFARRPAARWRYAAAAVFTGASALLALLASGVVQAPALPATLQAVGQLILQWSRSPNWSTNMQR